jgi:hypothetical protein
MVSGYLCRLGNNSAEVSQSAKHNAPPDLDMEDLRVPKYEAETSGAPLKLPLCCRGHTLPPGVTRQENVSSDV